MRKIIFFALAVLCATSCSTLDCPLNNSVYMTVALAGEVDTLKDVLDVFCIRPNGTDSLYVNGDVNITKVSLPLSYNGSSDRMIFRITDSDGVETKDTITIEKTNEPHFESVDCAPAFFHTITSVSTTHHAIDKIEVNQSKVNYATTETHLYLYLYPRD